MLHLYVMSGKQLMQAISQALPQGDELCHKVTEE
jgi:hypothetical protein